MCNLGNSVPWYREFSSLVTIPNMLSSLTFIGPCIVICRVIQKDGLNWTVNGASTHARQLVAVFQVLCSLYGLTCVGYAQNSLEFLSRSPLIHVVGRSFCLYTESLFAQIGDSNDKCPLWRLNVETKTKRTLHSSRRLSFKELTNVKYLVLHSGHFALNWRCCTAVR